MKEELVALLRLRCPHLDVRAGEPMQRHISFRLGGPAAAMVFPTTTEELAQILRVCSEQDFKPIVLGAGTNVLVADEGIDALVICTRGGLSGIRALGNGKIEVFCGATLAQAACFARDLGLTGLEFAHGIPGTAGGGLYMNAGAYGGEICQVAAETTYLTPAGQTQTFCGAAQGFSYRHSAFQGMQGVIVKTVFQLAPGDPQAIAARMQELAEKRRMSQPLTLPSAGSTFKRPENGYAAALIEQAGLKGLQIGGAAVSEKHAGFVVNVGGATCKDVLALIAEVQKRVLNHAGVQLTPEVRFL